MLRTAHYFFQFVAPVLCCSVVAASMYAATPDRTASPAKIRLVAAAGDQFQYARQNARIPDQSLNMAVLRGLDKAVAADEPDAQRILLALNLTQHPVCGHSSAKKPPCGNDSLR